MTAKTAVGTGDDGGSRRMSRIDLRAQRIYCFLEEHRGEGYTMPQLCSALGIQPGAMTTTAIRRARDIATDNGLHFPPAVPANGFTYKVTSAAEDAIDPTLAMGRIRQGVTRREQVGIDFMRQERRRVHGPDRKALDAVMAAHEFEVAAAKVRQTAEDLAMEVVRLRREQRQ